MADFELESADKLAEKLDAQKMELSQAGALTALQDAKQIEAAIIVAKRFPRDIIEVEDYLGKLCGRTRFAEQAEFCYPRGGTDIKGATIKLMEAIAQRWGNIQFGVRVLNRDLDRGLSEMQAFAWDCESNVKTERRFEVAHTRDVNKTVNGQRVKIKDKLTDARDISEMEQNIGSRNVRACLERVIPRYIVDECRAMCEKTLNSDEKPLQDRIKDCKAVFAERYGLSGQQLEQIVGAPIANWTNSHLTKLRGIINALNDGNTSVEALLSGGIQVVTAKQAKELALLVGTDADKHKILAEFGYSEKTIASIAQADYEAIKARLK